MQTDRSFFARWEYHFLVSFRPQVLLKVCATAEVLEAAAEAMRLKIRCRTAADGSHHTMTTPSASAAAASASSASSNEALHPSLSTLNSAAAQHRRAWAYFERAKRDQYLGTPDPGSLFRSAERHVFFLLESFASCDRIRTGQHLSNF